MKISGITASSGEVVKALEFKIESSTSFMSGGGASAGKPIPGSLFFKKDLDASTGELLKKIVSGTHFPEIIFEYISEENSKPVTTYIITLTEAFLTQAQWLTPECPGCLALEHQFAVVFKKIKMDDPIRKKAVTWDIAQMKLL